MARHPLRSSSGEASRSLRTFCERSHSEPSPGTYHRDGPWTARWCPCQPACSHISDTKPDGEYRLPSYDHSSGLARSLTHEACPLRGSSANHEESASRSVLVAASYIEIAHSVCCPPTVPESPHLSAIASSRAIKPQ